MRDYAEAEGRLADWPTGRLILKLAKVFLAGAPLRRSANLFPTAKAMSRVRVDWHPVALVYGHGHRRKQRLRRPRPEALC